MMTIWLLTWTEHGTEHMRAYRTVSKARDEFCRLETAGRCPRLRAMATWD